MRDRPSQPPSDLGPGSTDDPSLQQEFQRLYQVTLYGRWLLILGLWLLVGLPSLWALRTTLRLWAEYLTWAAVRYGIAYHYWPAVGLMICVSLTLSVLLRQSRNTLWGLSKREQQRLRQQVLRIRQQGPSHPLWQWVCRRKQNLGEAARHRQDD